MMNIGLAFALAYGLICASGDMNMIDIAIP